MPIVRADGTLFQRPTDAEVYREAVLARLSVMVSACSAHYSQTSNLHCHPSLGDSV